MKRHSSSQLSTKFISATKTRNYLIGDPFIDYLELWEDKKNKKKSLILNYIFEKGIEYENDYISKLKEIHNLSDLTTNFRERFDKTREKIIEKVEILYQATLINYSNKTFGIPDLIMSKNKIAEIYGENINEPYAIIDIKYSKLKMINDGKELSGSIKFKPYKGQLYIYVQALNNLLNQIYKKKYKINYGFLIGNDGKLVKVTFDKEIISETLSAIEWYQDISERKYEIGSREEMYPNMKNKLDGGWYEYKREIAEKIQEISLIPGLSTPTRKLLLRQNITNINKIKDIDSQFINNYQKNINFYFNKPEKIEFNGNYIIDFEGICDKIFMISVLNCDNLTVKTYTSPEFDTKSLLECIPKTGKIYHYGNYEKWVSKKYGFNTENYHDLYKNFIKKGDFYMKGCYSHSLKEITKSLYNMGKINNKFNNVECNNGGDCYIYFDKLLNNKIRRNRKFEEEMKKYNQKDCKILYEIINYLNHYKNGRF